MADGVTVDTYTVATDDAGAAGHVQLFKLAYDANGSATLVTADSSGLKVQLGASLPSGSATIGDVTVSSLPALAAGTNAIGKLAANDGVDIGDVGVSSISAGSTTVGAFRVISVDNRLAGVTNTGGTYEGLTVALIDSSGAQIGLPAPAVLSATPSLDTSAYLTGDSMDTTVLSFSNAVDTSGGSGHILKMTVIDDDAVGANVKLHLFDGSVTPAAENAAHSLSDADAAKYIGTISTASTTTWQHNTLNQTCAVTLGPPLPYKLDSTTTLYGVLVAEAPQTHTGSGLKIKLHVVKDN